MEIVMQQVKLSTDKTAQSTAELYEAMGVEQPKRKKVRRGKRGGDKAIEAQVRLRRRNIPQALP